MDYESEVKMSSILEDLMVDGQVGESPLTSPIPNINMSPSSYAPNKKPEWMHGFYVPRSANVNLISLMEGKDDFQIRPSERYFKTGDSFSKIRGMIDKMRGKFL